MLTRALPSLMMEVLKKVKPQKASPQAMRPQAQK
jgi:hypothetical protein